MRRGTTIAVLVCLALGLVVPVARAAETMALQPDGKIVLGGWTRPGVAVLVRLGADGTLDSSFGGDGIVVDRRLRSISAVVVQPDGGIVAAGNEVLTRYASDGSRDRSFGRDGLARYPSRQILSSPLSLLLLPDGRIAVGGTPATKFGPLAAVAYAFSADGTAWEALGEVNGPVILAGLALQGDGSVAMAGRNLVAPNTDGWDAVLARFIPGSGGDPDPAFAGGTGLARFVYPGAGPQGTLPGALAAGGGELVVAGSAGGRLALARFGADGILDTGFGSGGFVTVAVQPDRFARANDAVVLSDGKILVAGDTGLDAGPPEASRCPVCWSPLAARFLADGGLDSGFGAGGVARIPGPGGVPSSGTGTDVLPTPDGGALVAGRTVDDSKGFVVAHLLANGALDPSFGDDGVAIVDPCQGSEADQRRVGCLPRAEVRLRTPGLSRGSPAIYLHVRPSFGWARIQSVRLRLPGPLRVRTARAGDVKLTVVGPSGRGPKRVKAYSHGFTVNRGGRMEALALTVPPGVLRGLKGPPHRKLAFRVTVRFRVGLTDGGEHTRVIRRPG